MFKTQSAIRKYIADNLLMTDCVKGEHMQTGKGVHDQFRAILVTRWSK